MEQIILETFVYKDVERMGLQCNYHNALNNVLKKLPGIQWSQTNKCWHLPVSKEAYGSLVSASSGVATINSAALKKYLTNKKKP